MIVIGLKVNAPQVKSNHMLRNVVGFSYKHNPDGQIFSIFLICKPYEKYPNDNVTEYLHDWTGVIAYKDQGCPKY